MAAPVISFPTYTAIVHSPDGVRFFATSERPDEVSRELAGYVKARCDDVLWPEASTRVRSLIASGRLHAAISLYFDRVGERWDEERLELWECAESEPEFGNRVL